MQNQNKEVYSGTPSESGLDLTSKLNLKVEYPPLYERLVSVGLQKCRFTFNKAIKMFNWEKLFQNKNINNQLKVFHETIVLSMITFRTNA